MRASSRSLSPEPEFCGKMRVFRAGVPVMIRSVLIFLALSLAGCTEMQHQTESRALELTLNAYANAVRWGDTQQMLAFVDPEALKAHPLSELDLQRYKQVRFVSYIEQPPMPAGPHEV